MCGEDGKVVKKWKDGKQYIFYGLNRIRALVMPFSKI